MRCIPCGQNLNFLASGLAAALTEGLTADEAGLLAGFVTGLGDAISAISVTKGLCGQAQGEKQGSEPQKLAV